MPYGGLRGWRGWRHFHEQTDADEQTVGEDAIQWQTDHVQRRLAEVDPREAQEEPDGAGPGRQEAQEPDVGAEDDGEGDGRGGKEVPGVERTHMQEAIKEEEKKLQEITKSIENERSERTRLEQEIKEEEKKFQELTNKVAHQIKEARAALYAT